MRKLLLLSVLVVGMLLSFSSFISVSTSNDGSDATIVANYYRGAKGADSPSFTPKASEYKTDAAGLVKNTHGVSVFDNQNSVISKGFTPHQVDLSTVSSKLQIKQRGNDKKHYEIMPKNNMSLSDFKKELAKIKCY